MHLVHCSAVTNTHLLTHTTQAPKEASGCLGSIDGQRIAERRSETSARQAAVHSTSRARVSNHIPCMPVLPHRAVGGLTSCVVARQVKRTRRALETAQSAQSVANKASSERDRRRLGRLTTGCTHHKSLTIPSTTSARCPYPVNAPQHQAGSPVPRTTKAEHRHLGTATCLVHVNTRAWARNTVAPPQPPPPPHQHRQADTKRAAEEDSVRRYSCSLVGSAAFISIANAAQ